MNAESIKKGIVHPIQSLFTGSNLREKFAHLIQWINSALKYLKQPLYSADRSYMGYSLKKLYGKVI